MRLTCFLVAQYADVSREGKLTIAGTVDNINVTMLQQQSPMPRVPLAACYLVAQIEFSLADGLVHAMTLRVLDDDKQEIIPAVALPQTELKMNAQGRPMRHNIIVALQGLSFPGPGDFEFELLVDNVSVGHTQFYVTETPATGA